MSERVTFVWDDRMAAYNFGPGHPLAPVRVELAVRLARDLGLLDGPNVVEKTADLATDDELMLVHTADYIASRPARRRGPQHGRPRARPGHRGRPGVPWHARRRGPRGRGQPGGHALGVGSGGRLRARGQHRGRAAPRDARRRRPGSASTTTSAVAIAWALAHGAERVAYVDIDVHHGDGVRAGVLGRPPGADHLAARVAAHPVPRHRLPAGDRRPRGRGHRGQRRAATRHRGRGLAARLPRRRPAAARVVPAAAAGDPARLRHPLPGPAGAPGADGGRAARGLRGRCTRSRTSTPTDAGCRSAAAGTSTSTWCPGPGRTSSARSSDAGCDPATAVPAGWREYVLERLGRTGPGHMTDGAEPVVPAVELRLRPARRPARPRGRGHPQRRVPAARAGPRPRPVARGHGFVFAHSPPATAPVVTTIERTRP